MIERTSCNRCGNAPPGRYRRAITGETYCDDCFRLLRRITPVDEPVPTFSCVACGAGYAAADLSDHVGLLICARCLTRSQVTGTAPSGIPTDQVARLSPALVNSDPVVAGLAEKTLCTHCWHAFPPSDILWISEHADLLGDPIAGRDAQLRFRPSRFDLHGDALDLMDMPCQLLACPRCHSPLPRSIVESPPLFLSTVGSPASGKSHFLAAMTWQLRHQLPLLFGVDFTDADTLSNQVINHYEQTLFLADDQSRPTALRKTEMHGELYRPIQFGDQAVSLPRPFMFTLRPQRRGGTGRTRTLCLYDNAGEHFQPGMDTAAQPGTQHLARSAALLFLFDPTQHPRLREQCRRISEDPQLHQAARTQRQEIVLAEAAQRIRRYLGRGPQRKHERPLLVVVGKADIWSPLLKLDLNAEPFVPLARDDRKRQAIDLIRVEETSGAVRNWLVAHAPEFVTAAEEFAENVIYVPVSSLGVGPSVQPGSGALGVKPSEIAPKWVSVPVLYALARWSKVVPGVSQSIKAASSRSHPSNRASKPPSSAEARS